MNKVKSTGDLEQGVVATTTTTATPTPKVVSNSNSNERKQLQQQENDDSLLEKSSWARQRTRWILATLLLAVGAGVSGAFLAFGIIDEKESSKDHFEQSATDLANSIRNSWLQYEMFSLWAHDSCHQLAGSSPAVVRPNQTTTTTTTDSSALYSILHMCSRREFRNLYEQIASVGPVIKALQFAPRVNHTYRSAVQDETRAWLAQHYPQIPYNGFFGRVWTEEGIVTQPVQEKEFYFPLHLVEPVEGNEEIIDYDTYVFSSDVIDLVLSTWKPSLSPPIHLLQDSDVHARGVFLTHPGAKTSVYGEAPHSVVGLVVLINDLLAWAVQHILKNKVVYLFDSTQKDEMLFLGGLSIQSQNITRMEEIAFEDVPVPRRSEMFVKSFAVVDRSWTVVISPLDDSNAPTLTFVVLGGAIIFVFFSLLACVLIWQFNRMDADNRIKAEAAKAVVAQQQVARERHLNEYLAHEVRNPLTSAMAALSFVTQRTRERVTDEETRQLLLDDAGIVDSSLTYINDLLRSMLDVNRAKSGQIKVKESPTDILRDVLEPVAAILFVRGVRVNVQTECPPELMVMSDQLRLKQVILNLSINSTKFVQQGFIRLRADVVNDSVVLFVEDSGVGVPIEKRDNIFDCFQDSLDLLQQGTGVGLSICSDLAQLLDAKIWLDTSYNSGLPGSPGARFVLDLQKTPIKDFCSLYRDALDSSTSSNVQNTGSSEPALPRTETTSSGGDSHELAAAEVRESAESDNTATATATAVLPESMRVLFVEDEAILRKLFIRTVKQVAPTWIVSEAGNGERALQLARESEFDLIFMDQYMPAINLPLLGTDVVRRLRSMGVSSLICGLSANELSSDFIDSGADAFLLKPFPCKKQLLLEELLKIFRDANRLPKRESSVLGD